ncbi:MAG: Ca-activated chloride channel family protein [Ilumatobacter sp.]|jgi:Ca-activated chloride channel family protein
MKHINVNRTLVAVAAAGTILAACGADDSSSAVPDAQADADEGRASDGLEPETTEAAEQAAEDEGADDGGRLDSGNEQPTSVDSEAEFDSSEPVVPEAGDESEVDGGGLFGEEEPAPVDAETPEDGDSRFDDNRFEDYGYRDFVAVADDPLSTFALDVDTGSYSIGRRFLDEGALPPRESVRPEEYVNAFDYDYSTPRDGLDISVDGGPSPFNEDNVLVRIGVQGEIVSDDERGDATLTFVIDTSGSMDQDNRLGLVKESLTILVEELNEDDRVAIVTYSDTSGVVLEPTRVGDMDRIINAISDLTTGGSTNLESGLREGYDLARSAFNEDGINRVIIASDGVANAGITDVDELGRLIREDADAGIDLVTIGFGLGNFNDVLMEQLADNGDGFYAYVDTIDEAEKLFEDELVSTLLTVAKDAKIQVNFESRLVDSYRLIGFENRGVRDSDFTNDDVDAGELGAGHQVTAIYEINLADGVRLDDRGELGVVALRWEDPASGEVTEIDEDIDLRDIEARWTDTPDDFQLATVVVTFAEKLRDNPYADGVDIDNLAEEADRIARALNNDDVDELANLIQRAADFS